MRHIRTAARVAAYAALAAGVMLDGAALSRAVHTHGLDVNGHGVVQRSTLNHCEVEDGSHGPLPCTWNVGPGVDGNGAGLSYWVSRDHRFHYVWPDDPTADSGWRWVSRSLADSLVEGGFSNDRPWERCVTQRRHGGRWVQCPDGMDRRVS